jgi:hypothetical protein
MSPVLAHRALAFWSISLPASEPLKSSVRATRDTTRNRWPVPILEDIMPPRSTAQKRAMYGYSVERISPVTEVASQVREGLEVLARAVCALAVERHAKDPGHHRELAAVLYLDALNEFRDVKVRPETRDWLAKLLGIDPKNTQKFHGR